jgi:glutaminyl-peptide cyclotransferase
MTPPHRHGQVARLNTIVLAAAIAIFAVAASTSAADSPPLTDAAPDVSLWKGQRAMADIARQLTFGPRSMGAPGHAKVVAMIEAEAAKFGATVSRQQWTEQLDGKPVAMTNVIVRFAPLKTRRILLGTHYDSIVRAYRDKQNPTGTMPGANNSASGVALLLETGRVLGAMRAQPAAGIDLVFFDGEEGPLSLGEGDANWRPLGSPYFASHLADYYPARLPEKAVVFDMVCYRDLKLRPDAVTTAAAFDAMKRFWEIGRKIAPGIFISEGMPAGVSDDQVALANAGIPSFLVIGFEYDPWFNTTKDTLDKCSASSMEAVGRTLFTYLYTAN